MQRRALLRSVAGGCGVGVGLGLGLGLSSGSAIASAAQESYEPLGSVPVDGACEVVVGDDQETAYLATVDGFATVDVSDPADPQVLADRRGLLEDVQNEDRSFTEILDVEVSGDRLIVPGPANPGEPDIFHGFLQYDVSDPANPTLIGEPVETGYHLHNCFLDGDRLYLPRNEVGQNRRPNAVEIYDLSGDDPQRLGEWSLLDHEPRWDDVTNHFLWYLHDVTVHDEIAVLPFWNAGTYLVDVSDPSEPTYVSHVSETSLEEQLEISDAEMMDYYTGLPGNDHYGALDDTGSILAVGREAWVTDAPEANRHGGIDLYDVSDLENPVHAATIDAPETPNGAYEAGQWTTSHNFELHDGHLYSSWYRGGVKLHDLSTLEEPEEIAAWRDPSVAAFWTARVLEPSATFVASSTPILPNAETEGALYVFASEAGEQADPPSFEGDTGDPSEDADGNETDAGNDGNETDTGNDENESDPGDNETADADAGAEESESDSTPGFTAAGAAGVVGGTLALEAWRRRR
ncbi:LVIVD repeat-containing protein [Saliphagus sp. GCM10025317]